MPKQKLLTAYKTKMLTKISFDVNNEATSQKKKIKCQRQQFNGLKIPIIAKARHNHLLAYCQLKPGLTELIT